MQRLLVSRNYNALVHRVNQVDTKSHSRDWLPMWPRQEPPNYPTSSTVTSVNYPSNSACKSVPECRGVNCIFQYSCCVRVHLHERVEAEDNSENCRDRDDPGDGEDSLEIVERKKNWLGVVHS